MNAITPFHRGPLTVSSREIARLVEKRHDNVKRMQMLYRGQVFNWRELRNVSTELGLPPIDVFDVNYGEVKAYHADPWREVYALVNL